MRRRLAYGLVLCAAVVAGGRTNAHDGTTIDIEKFTRMVRVGNLIFPVVDYGKGPVVLMMHGFPDSRHVWRYQIKAIGDAGFRVVAPDLRGLGDSPKFVDPEMVTHDKVVSDMVGLLDALSIDKVQLVAHDRGAVVGWRLTAEHPQRIERYVAMSIGAPGRNLPTIRAREKAWYSAFFREKGAEEQLMTNDWQLFRQWQQAKPKADVERDIQMLSRPNALTSALNGYRAAPLNARLPTPPPVTVPVLVVWSDGDAYIEEDGLKTSGERVKGPFRYEKIYGASHWLQLDRPDEINELLLGFLHK